MIIYMDSEPKSKSKYLLNLDDYFLEDNYGFQDKLIDQSKIKFYSAEKGVGKILICMGLCLATDKITNGKVYLEAVSHSDEYNDSNKLVKYYTGKKEISNWVVKP